MPEYTVLSGTHRRDDGSVAEPGDTVELSEAMRSRFSRKKFERVEADAESESAAGLPDDYAENGGELDAVEPETAETEPLVADDVLESAGSDDAADTTEETTDEAAPDEAVDASGALPDDWELLQSMAVVYEGTDVKGNSAEADIREHFSEFSDTEIAHLKQQARERLYDEPQDAQD